ncbi:hypothetical protein CCACVL1_26095 [Corchorus capsularis]|uniref:Uncharacterized protein n=1 Tax=Corchorus capsularis TaxID=210143 RepID=A0A1R3GFZ9_COCAP|nr:hypothetical protein CCACVL1_26095 [Corchorus capsularis]
MGPNPNPIKGQMWGRGGGTHERPIFQDKTRNVGTQFLTIEKNTTGEAK